MRFPATKVRSDGATRIVGAIEIPEKQKKTEIDAPAGAHARRAAKGVGAGSGAPTFDGAASALPNSAPWK